MLHKRLVFPVAIGKRTLGYVSKEFNGRRSNPYLTLPKPGTPPGTT
jgi:hypothetical protein